MPLMNSFYKHHRDSIRWHYRCFDRILLNGLIQPFQLKDKKIAGVAIDVLDQEPLPLDHPFRSAPPTCWQRRISATSPAAFTLASIGIRSRTTAVGSTAEQRAGASSSPDDRTSEVPMSQLSPQHQRRTCQARFATAY